jgi:hypothetical protein
MPEQSLVLASTDSPKTPTSSTYSNHDQPSLPQSHVPSTRVIDNIPMLLDDLTREKSAVDAQMELLAQTSARLSRQIESGKGLQHVISLADARSVSTVHTIELFLQWHNSYASFAHSTLASSHPTASSSLLSPSNARKSVSMSFTPARSSMTSSSVLSPKLVSNSAPTFQRETTPPKKAEVPDVDLIALVTYGERWFLRLLIERHLSAADRDEVVRHVRIQRSQFRGDVHEYVRCVRSWVQQYGYFTNARGQQQPQQEEDGEQDGEKQREEDAATVERLLEEIVL